MKLREQTNCGLTQGEKDSRASGQTDRAGLGQQRQHWKDQTREPETPQPGRGGTGQK